MSVASFSGPYTRERNAIKPLIIGLCILVALAWGQDVFNNTLAGHVLWIVRQEALYLSGLLSMALMSLAMFLATRPAWLETFLGGMDRIYRTHKWVGILAIGFAVLHWLVEMSDDILKATIGREGRVPKENAFGFVELLRDGAENLGEWAIYAILAMLAITLWKKFPYRRWHFLHRAMPVFYLMLMFHAAMLAPGGYWGQPVGWLLMVLFAAGLYGSFQALTGRIGHARVVSGKIIGIQCPDPKITTVFCRLDSGWRGHHPGQFAFVTFDAQEGAHPFTIASADRGDRVIIFQIKALGDYTTGLVRRLQPEKTVRVEGPYGRFAITRCDAMARQVWIAGGIGITPFLAWLEFLQSDSKHTLIADLHYCTHDRDADGFVPLLETLCTKISGIRLQIYGSRQGDRLKATLLGEPQDAEIWYCGPNGLAEALKKEFKELGHNRLRFHQEAFELR